jgi:HAD superfamily hydrolase (TIGR01490 family)
MRAAFFDVDGTLTTTNAWKGIMDYFRFHGKRRGTNLLFLLIHYPLYFIRRLGAISEGEFRSKWAAHLGWYFRGYSEEDGEKIWNWVVENYIIKSIRNDTYTILIEHLDDGDLVVLLSGGPVPLLKRIAQELGVEHVVGTQFEFRDGQFTGRVLGPVCMDDKKASLTQAYLTKKTLDVDMGISYAYADAISDLPLFEMVNNPVCVYPDQELREIAINREWRIYP